MTAILASSPILARFDLLKITFLKTDWSSEGMGWILIQRNNNDASIAAATKLKSDGICDFGLAINGAPLKPIAFGSRDCNENERNFHSFTGEGACNRWAITQNCKYLWGCHFYWLCDCSAINEILEYDRGIPMICRWALELLGYQFSVIHRNARMVADADALTRRFEPLIGIHYCIANILRHRDTVWRPLAYCHNIFHSCITARLCAPIEPLP